MKRIVSVTFAVLAAGSLAMAANEITANITLRVNKGKLDVTRQVAQQYNVTALQPNAGGLTQNVLTNALATPVTRGDVLTNGWAYFRNLETSGVTYIEIGHSPDAGTSFYPVVRLNAGEPACMRLSQAVDLYAKASPSNAVLEKLIVDN